MMLYTDAFIAFSIARASSHRKAEFFSCRPFSDCYEAVNKNAD